MISFNAFLVKMLPMIYSSFFRCNRAMHRVKRPGGTPRVFTDPPVVVVFAKDIKMSLANGYEKSNMHE